MSLEDSITMMFRRLYWVTEQLDEQGRSEVTGVYTSIPDLVRHGIRWSRDCEKHAGFRLTLVKLDHTLGPLGCWSSPKYEGLEDDLQTFIETDEFTVEQCKSLMTHLEDFSKAPA
jgi:hypothetical protein